LGVGEIRKYIRPKLCTSAFILSFPSWNIQLLPFDIKPLCIASPIIHPTPLVYFEVSRSVKGIEGVHQSIFYEDVYGSAILQKNGEEEHVPHYTPDMSRFEPVLASP